MGVRMPSVSTKTLVNTTIVTTAETVALTSPAINVSLDFQVLLIFWFCRILTGASTTAVQVILRRGTDTTGTQVNVTSGTIATAAAGFLASGCYFDTPGAIAGQQYSLNLVQTAASANGTISDGSLIVMGL